MQPITRIFRRCRERREECRERREESPSRKKGRHEVDVPKPLKGVLEHWVTQHSTTPPLQHSVHWQALVLIRVLWKGLYPATGVVHLEPRGNEVVARQQCKTLSLLLAR